MSTLAQRPTVPEEMIRAVEAQAKREKRTIYVWDDSVIDAEHPFTVSTVGRKGEVPLGFSKPDGKWVDATPKTTGAAAITPAGKKALEEEPAEGTEDAGPPNGNGGGFWDDAKLRTAIREVLGEVVGPITDRVTETTIKGVQALLRKHKGGIVATNERRYELEIAEGVEPIDQVHAARRDAAGRLAVLEARYEVWDARRKNHRQGVMTEIGLELEKKDQEDYKVAREQWKLELETNPKAAEPKAPKGSRSEAELERLAAKDERVVKLLDDAEQWLADLFITRNEVKEYDEIIMRDQAVLRLRAREREL